MAGAYPVSVEFPNLEFRNKFFAVPVLGIVVRAIFLIPLLIALDIVQYIVGLAMLLTWIPVLFAGAYPGIGRTLYGGYLRWNARVRSYLFGLQDKYPSFSFDDEIGSGDVTVAFQTNDSPSRLWAIPVVGIVLKGIVLIPHLIVLAILSVVCGVLQLVTWIPVLATGEYPAWGMTWVGGYIRWTIRVGAYLFGLTDQYPLFSLS
jgi:hypothetical protein